MSKSILQLLMERGVLVDPDAADMLSRLSHPDRCVKAILEDENRPLVLTKADVEGYAASYAAGEGNRRSVRAETLVAKCATVSIRENGGIKILKDITGDSTSVGNVIDFAKLFNDRFSEIRKMLARRRELAGMVPISKAWKVQRDVRFVGIVNDVRTTKNGHTMVELEDETNKIQILLMKGVRKASDTILRDEVIGIVGSFNKDGELFIAKEVVRPDVPMNSSMVPNGSDSLVAFVSDIHVGSNTFLADEWARFMRWLNKDPVAKDVKYIIMPGDLVDGIGIYPDQEDELLIEDVYGQYQELSQLVKSIPDRIRTVMMPGNHDAVRLAEPQPALPKEITSMFDSHVLFVGNPCLLEIEGRTILAYHGRSMDDFNASMQNLGYDKPLETMREMLRRRHLAPIYGERTALAPEQKDYLVIDRVPNVFVTGHLHKCAIGEYRGIKLIHASAWQSQTAFQRMHNQNPEPAKVPVMHLGTGETWVEDFSS